MTMDDVKIFFGRIGTFLSLQTRWYATWSKLYRFIYERQYKQTRIASYRNVGALVQELRRMVWTIDTWRELFDAISSPQKVQHTLNTEARPKAGDCDEFAIYSVNAIDEAIRRGEWVSPFSEPQLLSICWYNAADKKYGGYGGHNVCLLRTPGPSGEMGYCYMDYGYPSAPRETKIEVVRDVINRYTAQKGGAECIGWAIHTPDLKLLEYSSR